MVDSISNSQTPLTVSSSQNVSTQSSSTLSSYQKEYIGALLENYDSSSLSGDDALEIVSALKDKGIAPSQELASTMEDSGFNAAEIGNLAGVGRPEGGMPPPPPPPPQGGNQSTEEEESYISELLDSLLSVDEEEDESTTTASEINGVSFGEVMDYTSRIVNLNEESQDKVMNLLSDLNSKESELSDEQKSTIVKHNLGQLLTNPDNYNRVSFYA